MRVTDLLAAKRDGREIPREDLYTFASSIARGDVPDYQVSAWLMAAYVCGLSPGETVALTCAMRDSGSVLSWDGRISPLSDKHSTGGVGDKVSLALAPLAASMGLYVPMISGKSLAHTGGTLDKLGSIPGMNTDLELPVFQHLVEDIGFAMSGQTDDLAPADRVLYALRDATATVTSIPLICASILSKKLAENTDSLVFDVKYGSGAFMKTPEEAVELGQMLVDVSRESGVRAKALITDMSIPLGMSVGNSLEVRESIDLLMGGGPADVRKLVIRLTAEMVALSSGDSVEVDSSLLERCSENLDNGKALDLFSRMVEAQGGDLHAFGNIPQAPVRTEIRSKRTGFWTGIDAGVLGEAVRELGGGRYRIEDGISPAVGWEQCEKSGSELIAGQLIGLVHSDTLEAGEIARGRIEKAFVWDTPRNSLIYGVL